MAIVRRSLVLAALLVVLLCPRTSAGGRRRRQESLAAGKHEQHREEEEEEEEEYDPRLENPHGVIGPDEQSQNDVHMENAGIPNTVPGENADLTNGADPDNEKGWKYMENDGHEKDSQDSQDSQDDEKNLDPYGEGGEQEGDAEQGGDEKWPEGGNVAEHDAGDGNWHQDGNDVGDDNQQLQNAGDGNWHQQDGYRNDNVHGNGNTGIDFEGANNIDKDSFDNVEWEAEESESDYFHHPRHGKFDSTTTTIHPRKHTRHGDRLFFIVGLLLCFLLVASALASTAGNKYLVLLSSIVDVWTIGSFYWVDVRHPDHIDAYENDGGLDYDAYAVSVIVVFMFACFRLLGGCTVATQSKRQLHSFVRVDILTVLGLCSQLVVLILHIVITKHASTTVVAALVATVLGAVVQTWNFIVLHTQESPNFTPSSKWVGSSKYKFV